MTRDQMHVAIALMREAARVVGPEHSVALHVHRCTEDELVLAAEAGGERTEFSFDGSTGYVVELDFPAVPSPAMTFFRREPKVPL